MIEIKSQSEKTTTMRIAIILLALAYTALALPSEHDALHEFRNGNRIFTADFYKELSKVESGNMALSPFSAETILALTHEGARGESATEMVAGLSLPSNDEKTRQAIKLFLPQLTSVDEDLKLSTANKIYVGEDVKLENEFKQVAVDIYKSDVENVDFAKNVAAAKKINGWVEERTQNRIKDLVDPNALDVDTKVVLVNTLYFKGRWASPFHDYSTTKKKFHASRDKSVDVDMMRQTEYLRYHENAALNAKFLELSYQGGNVSMVFILPNEKEGLTALEQNMEDLLAPQPFNTERVVVEIPKFRIETKIDMIPILKELGIKKVFDKSEADLSGVSSTNKALVISEVVQKVFVDVNEAGTEAAAATAVIMNKIKSAIFYEDRPKHFLANHPFMYLIKSNGMILFAGRYKQ